MLLNSNSMAFGRNETFYLKYNWTFKALSAIEHNKDFLSLPDSYLDLGVGKNMLSSIKYWMNAYQILDEDRTSYRDDISKLIFDPNTGFDPYLEREETLWIMHWRLCSNPSNATLYYWFFNHFKNTRFTKDEILGSLAEWLKDTTAKKFSPKTLDRDINLLLKTYSSNQDMSEGIEDALENPFANLELLTKNSDGTYSVEFNHRDEVNCELFALAVINLLDEMRGSDLFNKREIKFIPLSDVIDSQNFSSIRNIFRLSENFLISSAEQMTMKYSKYFELSDSGAGQRNLIINDSSLSMIDVVKSIYQ